ncbi:MAG: hypothetical protein QOG16_22 [Actinomycetota bacterium]|jgi:hypothetical protein|nr:hypothetical protein [Actinomycetota bacterium]
MAKEPTEQEIREYFEGQIPKDWFTELELAVARDEIQVIGRLPDIETPAGGSPRVAKANRIAEWREESREQRMAIARDAEVGFGRKVSWGARCGDEGRLFAHLNIPVMTRLRARERAVLDTLVDAGVARSRSDALAWCARLVADKQKDWIDELRSAFAEVEKVRSAGPVF